MFTESFVIIIYYTLYRHFSLFRVPVSIRILYLYNYIIKSLFKIYKDPNFEYIDVRIKIIICGLFIVC